MSDLFFGTPERREQAKEITHGLNYGRGARSIAQQTGLPVIEVEEMMERYAGTFPGVAAWQDYVRAQGKAGRRLESGTGRLLNSDPDRSFTTSPSRAAQACARDLFMTGVFRLGDYGLSSRVRLLLHDEVILSVPEPAIQNAGRELIEAMSFNWPSPSGLVIPIAAHAAEGYGPRWSDLYKQRP